MEAYPNYTDFDTGRMPADALFHAEVTVLLRAAAANGGSLAGKTLAVYVDKPMCNSCNKLLPLVGIELGNPVVIFIGPNGVQKKMFSGSWD